MKFKRTYKKTLALSLALTFLIALMQPVSIYAAALPDTAPVTIITAFTPLDQDAATVYFENKPALAEVTAKLPAALQGTIESAQAPADIPVTWNCTTSYDTLTDSKYIFTPVWDAALYALSPSLDAAAVPAVTVYVNTVKSSVFFTNPATAAEAMSTLASGKTILALVYLTEEYQVKDSADANAASPVTVSSGQSVQIIGAQEDSLRNIWYQVSFESESTTYTGYIERSYLACSDEDFKKFEQSSINTFRQRSAVTFSTDYSDVNSFPDSYQPALRALKDAHPNWLFVKMDTTLDWSSVIREQNKKSRSLVPASSTAAWKNGLFDSSWAYASDGILAYSMDPRNYLDETNIFQFELLTYNPSYHTEAAVQAILSNSFMASQIPNENTSYAAAFFSIGSSLQVSPFHLACRVYQEQGANGTSPLISGSYPGFEGYYNYFNIGATGQGNTAVIQNGLKKAQSMGWNTRMLSLSGGADQISKNYIRKGQDTLYLQKFNVNPKSGYGLYEHQYMQNILAPAKEALNIKKSYAMANAIGNSFVFKIPVYSNMPGSACAKPTTADSVALDQSAISFLVDQTWGLTASVNGSPVVASSVTFTSENPGIASVNSSGVVTGVYPGTTTITCTKSGGTTATCQVTIAKADPVVSPPAPSGITYQPGQVLGSIPLPAGWSWNAPQTVPVVGNAGYPATYTPADSGKYNSISSTIPLPVAKGTPAYSVPTGLGAPIGTPLSSIGLPAGFTWESPTATLQTAGSQKASASYNPDAGNYNTVTGIAITITVYDSNSACISHTFSDWAASLAPTCTAEGLDIRSCTKCGFSETRTAAALGHQFNKTIAKEPTETADGSAVYTCSRCGSTYSEGIGKLPHQHSYTPTVTKVETCTEKGVKTFTCACGYTTSEEIPALGHSHSAKVTAEPTEKATGTRTYTCTRCSDSYTETIAKLASSHTHSYTDKVTKEAACTESGEKTFTCSCGDTYKEGIQALGHDMRDGKCSRCGYEEQPKADSTTALTGTATPPKENGGSTTTPPAEDNGTTGTKSPSAAGSASKPDVNTPAASSQAVTVNMTDNTVLYEETLKNIKGNDIDLVLDMGDDVSWTIHGSNITGDDANGVDMGITLNSSSIPPDKIKELAGENHYIEVTLAHEGGYLFQPVLTLKTDAADAGRYATLLYYNPDSQMLEFVAAVPVASDGSISIPFTHASDYAVIIADAALDTAVPAVSPDAADTEGNPPEPAATGSEEPAAKEEAPLSASALLIIGVICILCIGIGVTAYLVVFRKPKEDSETDEDEDNEEDDDEDEEYEAGDDDQIEEDDYMEEASFDEVTEITEDDRESFIDDYREPELPLKRRGKVVSIANTKEEPKKDDFDKDEFDGFE